MDDAEFMFYTKIAGVSRRQRVARRCNVDEALLLIRDHANHADENAVCVMRTNGDQVGFLGRDVAEDIAPMLDGGQTIFAIVTDVTGGSPDKPTVGVNIALMRGSPETDIPDSMQAEGSRVPLALGVAILAILALVIMVMLIELT